MENKLEDGHRLGKKASLGLFCSNTIDARDRPTGLLGRLPIQGFFYGTVTVHVFYLPYDFLTFSFL